MSELARLQRAESVPEESSGKGVLPLMALVGAGVALGFVLWWLNGPPQVPTSAPDWDRISRTLAGSDVPYEDVMYIATGLGWLALSYLGLTVALRVVLGAADRLTDGSAWARVGLGLSDLVTLPVVRRAADGALAGVVFLAVWLRTSGALEAGASTGAVAAVSGVTQAGAMQGVAVMAPCPPAPEAMAEPPPPNCVVSYAVVEGDNLWDIARRFYGDGTQYVVIFRLNEGRVMTTGEPFTNPRLIRPGWVLDVPLPGYNVWAALPPAHRSRLVALVDESSTLGAADYGHMLSELSKYGASFVLVAQSLAKLDAIDEALRPTVFSNIDGLTVFQVSAQDARYLVPELGAGLEVDDLTALDDFECYARWWADGRRLPTFSLRLDPPPSVDRGRLPAMVRRSAERFGRPGEQVAKEIDDALAGRGVKVVPSGQASATVESAQQGTQKMPHDTQPTAKQNPKTKGRSDNRDRR